VKYMRLVTEAIFETESVAYDGFTFITRDTTRRIMYWQMATGDGNGYQ